MCLILFGIAARPASRTLLLANRDEFHARPSAAAGPWAEDRRVLGGRDLVAGGSWLAVRGDGRFAALTNLRNGVPQPAARSRGDLVREFILGADIARDFLVHLQTRVADYAPFNLLLGDAAGSLLFDGATRTIRTAATGLGTIGNGPLDADWPKARRLRTRVETALEAGDSDDHLLDLLRDEQRADDAELPDTGMPLERERLLSSIFIAGATYGTRASTWFEQRTDGSIDFIERAFGPAAVCCGEVRWRFDVAAGCWRRGSTEH